MTLEVVLAILNLSPCLAKYDIQRCGTQYFAFQQRRAVKASESQFAIYLYRRRTQKQTKENLHRSCGKTLLHLKTERGGYMDHN